MTLAGRRKKSKVEHKGLNMVTLKHDRKQEEVPSSRKGMG
jgi:hypothetical protein